MKNGKKKAPAGSKSRRPTNVNRAKRSSAPSDITVNSQHVSKLNEVHPELRAMVNNFLSEKNIPLKVHTMHFAEKVGKDFKCCLINGRIVCGPQCF